MLSVPAGITFFLYILPLTCHTILQIVKAGLMSKDDFDEARSKALSLFEYGQVNSYVIFFLEAPRSMFSDPPWLASPTKLQV
jgi:hypothetical protein